MQTFPIVVEFEIFVWVLLPSALRISIRIRIRYCMNLKIMGLQSDRLSRLSASILLNKHVVFQTLTTCNFAVPHVVPHLKVLFGLWSSTFNVRPFWKVPIYYINGDLLILNCTLLCLHAIKLFLFVIVVLGDEFP